MHINKPSLLLFAVAAALCWVQSSSKESILTEVKEMAENSREHLLDGKLRKRRQADSEPVITICGGTYEEPTGRIFTPNFPLNYPNLTFCSWQILVSPPYEKVQLNFVPALHIEPSRSDGTCYDQVSLYNGISSASENFEIGYCGEGTPPTFVSSGPALRVLFSSDISVERAGFIALYKGLRADNTTDCA